MKLSQGFDECLRGALFLEKEEQASILISGACMTGACILGAISMRKVNIDILGEAVSSSSDPMGILIYITLMGIYFGIYAGAVKVANLYVVGFITVLIIWALNFILLGVMMALVKKVKAGFNVRDALNRRNLVLTTRRPHHSRPPEQAKIHRSLHLFDVHYWLSLRI